MAKKKMDDRALEILEKHVEMFENPKVANGLAAQITSRSARKLFSELGLTEEMDEKSMEQTHAV